MLPPTKRFKMENRVGVQIHQNGIETSKIGMLYILPTNNLWIDICYMS